MIGLDTNVLVRYLADDDPRQSPEAARLIDRALAAGRQLFVPQIVMCELVWVLSFAYEMRRSEIVSILQQLRRAAQLVIEGPDQVQRAIDSYGRGKGDFAGYLRQSPIGLLPDRKDRRTLQVLLKHTPDQAVATGAHGSVATLARPRARSATASILRRLSPKGRKPMAARVPHTPLPGGWRCSRHSPARHFPVRI